MSSLPSNHAADDLLQLAVLIFAGALVYTTAIAALWKLSLSFDGAEQWVFAQLRQSLLPIRLVSKTR